MQNFSLLVLAAIASNPRQKGEGIAHTLGVPRRAVEQAQVFLLKRGLLREEDGFYSLTPAGKEALDDFNLEKAKNSALAVKQATQTICLVLDADKEELSDFGILEKGMTNDSYVFRCRGKKYIYRRAGTGSDVLVDRFREYANYLALGNRGISDVVVYHNPFTGTKISEFIEDSKGIDPENPRQMSRALDAVRRLHTAGINSPRDFDFLKTIDYYEEVCRSAEARFFPDYRERKEKVSLLIQAVEKMNISKVFCHIDFVPGNCLLEKDGRVTLIDWEYSGRQDPIVDIAMFCLSAAFDRQRSEKLLDDYLQRPANENEKFRFYVYMTTASLMWSLWSIYKTSRGEVFEGYTDRMYATNRQYSALAFEMMKRL